MKCRDFFGLAKCAAKGWVDDAAPSMGAALAFYALLSLAPLILVVVSLAGLVVGRDEAQAALYEQIAAFMGEGSARAIESVVQASGTPREGAIATAIGMVMALLGASTVFGELRRDLDIVWRYKAPKMGSLAKLVRARLKAFSMVLAGGLLLLASVVLTTWVAAMGEWLGASTLVARAIDFAVSFVVMTGLFAMVYKILPSARIDWSDVWAGAAVTAILFWIGKILIALYLSRAAVVSSFGAAGAIVAVVVWMYYSAQVFFLGAEFTRQYALRHGSHQGELQNQRRVGDLQAANTDDFIHEGLLVQRAEQIVKGRDPAIKANKGV